jgi:hypothetical protein
MWSENGLFENEIVADLQFLLMTTSQMNYENVGRSSAEERDSRTEWPGCEKILM